MDIVALELEEGIVIDYRGAIIRIRVFGLYNGQVKFGIEASPGIPINREEVYEIVQAQKKAKALYTD